MPGIGNIQRITLEEPESRGNLDSEPGSDNKYAETLLLFLITSYSPADSLTETQSPGQMTSILIQHDLEILLNSSFDDTSADLVANSLDGTELIPNQNGLNAKMNVLDKDVDVEAVHALGPDADTGEAHAVHYNIDTLEQEPDNECMDLDQNDQSDQDEEDQPCKPRNEGKQGLHAVNSRNEHFEAFIADFNIFQLQTQLNSICLVKAAVNDMLQQSASQAFDFLGSIDYSKEPDAEKMQLQDIIAFWQAINTIHHDMEI
ncbi:hypothetical protein NM688_g453 [Phlebia brevispora]|uniref:Uncharacterized protein n=1 Tax=Phlebia brevispora TaxID=194682 RepID=A0ACC1TE57_9APHY|nr:hypothetical protein NM688_g453 [Phlebia brevispora]